MLTVVRAHWEERLIKKMGRLKGRHCQPRQRSSTPRTPFSTRRTPRLLYSELAPVTLPRVGLRVLAACKEDGPGSANSLVRNNCRAERKATRYRILLDGQVETLTLTLERSHRQSLRVM